MRDIDRLKYELAEALKSSEEYLNYKKCKDLLAEKPDIERSVDDMRRQTFELQNSEGFDNSFEAIDDFSRRFEIECSQDVANNFLKAELCLCRMVQEICKTIIEDIDFNLDFLK